MSWELESVLIENFLSIQQAELQIKDRGLVLIEGKNLTSSKFKSNGAGKSSIIESVVYVLYDTTTKGLKADEVVNNKIGKNTKVIANGTKDGHKYRIERYRKHTKFKNKVKLFCDDQEITGKSTAETNKMIEQLIGIDYNTFINSIIFSQSSGAGRFAIATDKEKKEILEGVVNLAIYVTAQSIAKDRVKAKENEILAHKRDMERTNWEFAQIDQLEEQDQQNYQNTLNVIKQHRESIGTLTQEMTDYTTKYFPTAEQLRGEIEELKKKVDSVGTMNISTHMDKAQAARNALQEIKNAINQYTNEKEKHVSDYKRLSLATNCPVCGSELDPVHREQEMASIKEKLKQVLIQQQMLSPQLEQAQGAYEVAAEEYNVAKQKHDELLGAQRAIMDEIRSKEQWVTQYEQGVQTYKNKIHSTQETLNTLGEIAQPTKRDKEREAIREKLNAQKEKLLTLELEKNDLETAVKVYSNSGVKSHVLDLVTPFLNKRGNAYLSILSGPDMELKFSTQTKNKDGSVSDKFDIQVINHAGGDEYKAQSEGEKKRADLSIALALQDFVASKSVVNFALYDEVFDALDEVGSENVVTLLRERAKTVPTIWVITHSEHLKALFEKVITITKHKNGISTIKEGEITS